MVQIKLRMGNVDADEALPNLEYLENEAESAGIKGGRGNRRYAEEVLSTDEYLYMFFTKEVTEERRQFIEGEDEDDVSVEYDDTFVARSMRFLLRNDNYYAFESTTGVYGEDAIKYLLHDTEIIGLDCSRTETFPYEWMESFYERTYNIRKVKLRNTGTKDPGYLDDGIAEYVKETGGPTERAVFSTAGRDNNLRTSSLINALVGTSDLYFVSGKDAEGNLTKLKRTGRLTYSYPADLDHEDQAKRMFAATERILGHID